MNNKIIRKISESNGQYKITIPKVIMQLMGASKGDGVEISLYKDDSVILKFNKKI